MLALNLTLTLLDDLVASERPATEGGHASLDYLPGAMLLGAAAARLYGQLPKQDSFLLFHSGKVRFSDALPLHEDLPCWPMPLCWHEDKAKPAREGDWLVAEKIRNLQWGSFPEGVQPQQLREGYIRSDGRRVTMAKGLRMKTAIDPETGRVDESQLFGYESIAAGQCFGARIEADDDLPAALWSALADTLTTTEPLLLGRSRSAEYGRVWAVAAAQPLGPPTEQASNQTGKLTLWCLSDLALLDEYSQPSLEPTPARLGLERGEIDWRRTFLRFRRFASWNAHRRGYDLERQVIRRGSVITIAGIDPPLTDSERQRLLSGVGLHREIGLGRVAIDPMLLATPSPGFESRRPVSSTAKVSTQRPDHPLIVWLEAGHTHGEARAGAEAQAKRLAGELEERYRLARTFVGLVENQPIGPSPAQWGTVYEQARTANDLAALRRTLVEGENAVCKPNGEGWQDAFRDEVGTRSFAAWFAQAIRGLESLHAVRAFGREAQHIAKQAGGRDHRKEVSQ